MNLTKKRNPSTAFFCLMILLGMFAWLYHPIPAKAAPQSGTKIHFISLNACTDAILLESNGHFAMIDSGEDWDYTEAGTASGADPSREGITTDIGYDEQVIHYLKSYGVKKLDFYLGSHAHSDHIGTGNEVMKYLGAGNIGTLYLGEYDDSMANEWLWDNQLVYDQLIESASANGASIVQDFNTIPQTTFGAMSVPTITLGDMTIYVLNANKQSGAINDNSLVCLVEAYGKTALLTGDFGDYNEALSLEIADQTLSIIQALNETPLSADTGVEETTFGKTVTIESGEQKAAGAAPEDSVSVTPAEDDATESPASEETPAPEATPESIPESTPQESSPEVPSKGDPDAAVPTPEAPAPDAPATENVPENTPAAGDNKNPGDATIVLPGGSTLGDIRENDSQTEAAPNTNNLFAAPAVASGYSAVSVNYSGLDLLKLPHHGALANNPSSFLMRLAPKLVANTGPFSMITPAMYEALGANSAIIYSTNTDSASVVVNFSETALTAGYTKLSPGWSEANGQTCYFDENGRTIVPVVGDDKHPVPYHMAKINGQPYALTFRGGLISPAGIYTIDGDAYYIDESGSHHQPQWVKRGGIWHYGYETGSKFIDCFKDQWAYVNRCWYYFDAAGNTLTGWQQINGKTYYLGHADDGAMKSGWRKMDGSWYHFGASDDGAMKTGWQIIDKCTYYFKADGRMLTGWQEIDGKTYYLGHGDDGAMKKGWRTMNGKKYYFKDSGELSVDWSRVGGLNYYFTPSSTLGERGAMQYGWFKYSGKWYYLGTFDNGSLRYGWFNVGTCRYYANEFGHMQSGFTTISGKTYYFGHADDGALKKGWREVDGAWYYLDPGDNGAMKKGWSEIDRCTYYFTEEGKMLSSFNTIGGKTYYLGKYGDGALKKGWREVDGAWYYLDPKDNGAMKTGWSEIDRCTYYFTEEGKMLSSFNTIDGKTYYLGNYGDGALKKGWREVADKSGKKYWYYLDPADNGAMKTGWAEIDRCTYYFNEKGRMQYNFQTIDGETYYFGTPGDGAMKRGWRKIKGNEYYFYEDGKMAKDTTIDGKYVDENGVWIP